MKERLESIQVIRAIAFMLVFLSHVEMTSTGPVGVSLFLALSGFCMTYAYLDRPEKTPIPNLKNNVGFVLGKVRKLYPLHVITLLLVALVIFGGLILHGSSGKEIAEQLGYFIANILLLQSWIPWRDGYFSFNAVSWYLSTSVFSYFIFLWVFRAIQSKDKKRIAKLAGTSLALMIAVAVVLGIGKNTWGWTNEVIKWIVYICPLYRAGDFIFGLVAGYVFLSAEKKMRAVHYSIAEIIVVLLMVAQVFIYDSNKSRATYWTLTLYWIPTSVLCIYLFAVNRGVISRTLSKSKVLIWIGNISGEAFLIHQICIKATEYLIHDKKIVVFVAFAMTLICSVFWRWLYSKIQVKILNCN